LKKKTLAAQRVATSILKGISQLKTFPNLDVEVQQAPNQKMVRDLIIGNYIARSNKLDSMRAWHLKEECL